MAVLLAFSAEQVCRLTGLSMRQLRCWDNTGFFHPQYADEDRRRPHSRIYSFRDLVGLRVIAHLAREHRVPLQQLRRVSAWLSERYEAPWSTPKFYVAGRKVYFDDPISKARMIGEPHGQTVFPIEMQAIADEMEQAAQRLRERNPEDIGQIVRRRQVLGGAPTVAGTRIPTSIIWEFHETGCTPDAILREYPTLKREDVLAAIAYEEGRRQKRAS